MHGPMNVKDTCNLVEFRAVTKFINSRFYLILTKINIALGGHF
jgi:hypothetical protein